MSPGLRSFRFRQIILLPFLGCAELCDENPVSPSLAVGLITPDRSTIEVGETVILTAIRVGTDLLPGTGVTETGAEFSTSSTGVVDIVSVANGKATIVGVGPGTALILGTTPVNLERGIAPGSSTITVVPRVLQLAVSPSTTTIADGQSTTLECTVTQPKTGKTITDATLRWTSSNPAVATVSADGTVTGQTEGTTTITCEAVGENASATATVNVERPLSVTVTPAQATVNEGETTELICTVRHAVTGDVITDLGVSWSSSSPSNATVSNGTVTGVAQGGATITCQVVGRTSSGTAAVTVHRPLIVEPGPHPGSMLVGSTAQFSCTVLHGISGIPLPNIGLEWSSSDPTVATVDPDGVVTAVAPGPVTITCKAAGEPEFAAMDIVVTAPTPPDIDDIAGNYAVTGNKVADNCAPGFFPASIDNPGPNPFTVNGSSILFTSDTQMFGSYNGATGEFMASGSKVFQSGGTDFLLQETFTGSFRQVGTTIELVGRVTYEVRLANGGTLVCTAAFDVVHRKL